MSASHSQAKKGVHALLINNHKWLLCLLALAPVYAHAGTIYLCKAYNGGTFWAQAHCNRHNALIESIVSVPDNMPFDQQVKVAEQQHQSVNTTNSVSSTTTTTIINGSSATGQVAECKSLDAQILQLDAMARQPQSGQMQDWIAEQKRNARTRQFQIHC